MDRRNFVARTLAVFPILSAVASRPAAFKDITQVTVNHDGDKPIGISVTGTVIAGARMVKHTRDRPLELTTPASFYVNLEEPTVIQADGDGFIRVVADRAATNQHLVARASRVTIRRLAVSPVMPNALPRIEMIGEAKPRHS